MRFKINSQKLTALLLASCAIQVSTQLPANTALSQEIGLLEYVAEPSFGGHVSTASGVAILENASSRSTSLTTALLMQLPQDLPQVPPPPAAKGPNALDPSTISPSDNESSERGDAAKKSESALKPEQNRSLTIPVRVVDLSVVGLGTGMIPEAASEKRQVEASIGRLAIHKYVYWHPSSICHYPLRFENAMLERHGHVRFGCLQPLASGARFFATIPMLPYLSTLRPSCEPVYALGNYRPGSCAPLLRDTIPYDKHAAVVEALTLAGFFWAMPL